MLLTGATTGIGLAIARRLIARGTHRVVLTAREASISRFAVLGVHESDFVHIRALDVVNAEQREAVVAEADQRWGGVDVLINNAGVAYRAVMEHAHDADRHEQIEVNFVAPMELIRLVLPSMRAKRRGRIVTVSSVGGMMAMPTMALYSASKFALEGAHESLWYEVKPWGIHVSLLQPGFVHSDGFLHVRRTRESRRAETHLDDPYHAHYQHMSVFIARLMSIARATPESVAKIAERTILRRHPALRVPATFDARVFSTLRRVLPRGVYHALLYQLLPHVRTWGPTRLPGGRPER